MSPNVSHVVGGANDTGLSRNTKAHWNSKETVSSDAHDHSSNGKHEMNTCSEDNDTTTTGFHE